MKELLSEQPAPKTKAEYKAAIGEMLAEMEYLNAIMSVKVDQEWFNKI